VERLAALTLLVVLFPVITVLAAAVLVSDGRPVLYRQMRVGKNGRCFQIFKFRSMRTAHGAQISASTDSRITGLGKILRRYKLDELPQLWNVVRGDMSVIGPRPEVPDFVDMRMPAWSAVLSVRPGITDLATLAYRHEEQILGHVPNPEEYYRNVILPDKLALNLRYLRKRSLQLDIQVLLLTAAFSFLPGLPNAHEAVRILLEKARR
jgi:lipopolysaccharide/colanic/teichoic acid biosynthesis glycosyltransferase